MKFPRLWDCSTKVLCLALFPWQRRHAPTKLLQDTQEKRKHINKTNSPKLRDELFPCIEYMNMQNVPTEFSNRTFFHFGPSQNGFEQKLSVKTKGWGGVGDKSMSKQI